MTEPLVDRDGVYLETPEDVMEEIGRLVAEGYKHGQLGNGDGSTSAWSLEVSTWK